VAFSKASAGSVAGKGPPTSTEKLCAGGARA